MRVRPAGVTTVAAGAGWIWATVPDSRALWRIDPKTNHVTRIPMQYFPWGVAAGDDGVWVTVRANWTAKRAASRRPILSERALCVPHRVSDVSCCGVELAGRRPGSPGLRSSRGRR